MVEDFKKKLKENGQSLRWFYNVLMERGIINITYGGFNHQINGHAPLSLKVKKKMRKYLKDSKI